MNTHPTAAGHKIKLAYALAVGLTLGALSTLAGATTPGKNGLIAS